MTGPIQARDTAAVLAQINPEHCDIRHPVLLAKEATLLGSPQGGAGHPIIKCDSRRASPGVPINGLWYETALLNANPAIQGSSDLQVGSILQVDQGSDTGQKVGAAVSTFSRKASNAVGALAGDVGSSVQDLLDKNPDLKTRLDTLGNKVGFGGSGSSVTLSLSPRSGPPGSNVSHAASGLPRESPVAIGAGAPGSAYAVIANVQTSASGTIDTMVKVPEGDKPGSTLVFNISAGEGVLVRSDRFQVIK